MGLYGMQQRRKILRLGFYIIYPNLSFLYSSPS